MSLLHRLVITQRDGSIFAGNLSQLVDWDLHTRHDISPRSRPHSVADGFLLRSLGQPPETMGRRFVYLWTGIRLLRVAKRIRILYEKGPQAIRAYQPDGEWKQIWKEFKDLTSGSQGNLKQSLGEFKEDIVARKWKDVFLGREKSLQEALEKRQGQREEGLMLVLPPVVQLLLFLRRALESTPIPH